jgi:hypothetical protein
VGLLNLAEKWLGDAMQTEARMIVGKVYLERITYS